MQVQNNSHCSFAIACIFMLLWVFCVKLNGQTGISSFNTTTVNPPNTSYSATAPSDASNDINPGQTYDVSYGQGNDYTLLSYTIGGTTYSNFLEPDTLMLQRTDGGRFVNVWYTLIDIDVPLLFGTTELIMDGQEVDDADALYQTGSLISGYDNILVNVDNEAAGSIQAQIERVDAIWYTGIVSCAPENAVFPVIERGGNDSIKIAAITALDINGNPSAYGNMVEIVDNDWPNTGLTYSDYLVLRRQTVGENPLPLLNIGDIAGQASQTIQGVAVSFDELGIAAGQVIYGYSLFAFDTDDALHDLTDISTFPETTTAAASGIDLVAGVSAAVSSDNCLTLAIGPGGYKGALSTWLKANATDDVTTSTEGATITDWQDHWIGDNDFTTAQSAPTYRSSSSTINFNQTADFTIGTRGLTTSNNASFNNNGSSYERKGISIAFRTENDVTTRQVLYEQGGNTRGINIYIRNGSLYAHAWNRNNDGAGAPWNEGDATASATVEPNSEYILTFEFDGNVSESGTFSGYLNGQLFGTVSSIGLLFSHTGDINIGLSGSNQRYDDGTNGSFNSFRGEIPEFIYCNEPSGFSINTRNQIESYLAIKYGITLNQATPINYVNSSGAVIFNTTQSASLGGYLEYNNNITGIGRDDNSELDQQQSRSEHNESVITVSNGSSFSANNTWFIWGNDGEALTDTETTDVPSVINQRIERVWRVSETGETGTNQITFDLDSLIISGSSMAADYSLLVASNSSGGAFTGATIVSGGVLDEVENTITFTVDLSHGEYFTLGTGYIDCSPAGVGTNLSLWLKADLGPNASAGEVTEWSDLAGTNHAEGSGGTSPAYSANAINFNPALDFDGTADFLASATGFHTPAYYIVLVPDDNLTSASAAQVPLGWDTQSASPTNDIGGFFLGGIYGSADDVVGHIVGNGTIGYGSYENNSAKTISAGVPLVFATLDNNVPTATQSVTQQNGTTITTTGTGSFLGLSNEDYVLGRFFTPNDFGFTRFFDGKIAEVISYSARPTLTQNSQITSYLGIKYGITLSIDYLNAAGNTVWSRTTNTSYNNDIAGIGRDDNACLNQKQSTSQNSDAVVTIGLESIATTNAANTSSFDSDASFLIWGNDNAALTQAAANTVDVPGTVTERISRVWKVQETGTVGSVDVSLDLTGLGYTTVSSNFQLIISSTSTMASGVTYSGGTFDGNVITFEDVDFTNGDFFTLGTNKTACAPGGLTTDLALWLKANEGTNTVADEANISSWTDFSGNGRNAAVVGLGGSNPVSPVYHTSEVNFNPSIELFDPNSTNATFIETSGGNNVSEDLSIVAVFKSGLGGGSTTNFEAAPTIIGGGDSGGNNDYGLGMSGGRLHLNAASNTTLNARSPSGTLYNTQEPFIVTGTRIRSTASGAIQLYANSTNIASGISTNTSLSGPNTFGIGNHDDPQVAAQFQGHVAEVIVFSDDLTSTERARVESYLAIKYGISRLSTTDYLAADGGAIFSYTTNTGYTSDIAGIGRDDNSCLVQKKSKSENNDALVTMSVNNFSADDSFLIWANDNAAIESSENTEFDASQVKGRLNREWKVQETGTIGNVTLTYDLSAISGPSGIGTNNLNQVRLMVDADGDFSAGATLISPSSINAVNKTVSFTVNFSTGQYFTLGSEEKYALPIELLAFDAQKTARNHVKLDWATLSESDNAQFVIERSANGREFEGIGSLTGAGNSEAIKYYTFTDFEPETGYSFYRLKQIDFNGQTDYSEIKSVFVEAEFEEEFGLFTNPIRMGDEVKINYNLKEDKETLIQVLSPNGQLLWEKTHWLDASNNHVRLSSDRLIKGLNVIRIMDNQNRSKVLKLLVH
ncbi:hypothetical protein [Roseivirga pacifica]